MESFYQIVLPTISLIVSCVVCALALQQDREQAARLAARDRELGLERKKIWFWQASDYTKNDGWFVDGLCLEGSPLNPLRWVELALLLIAWNVRYRITRDTRDREGFQP